MDHGLIDYGARFYAPEIGRFTSPDTIIPDPYNSLDYDRYSYVRNNPLRFNDPSGHCIEDLCLIEIGVPVTLLVLAVTLIAYNTNPEVHEAIDNGVNSIVLLAEEAIENSRPDIYKKGDPNGPNLGLKTPDDPYLDGTVDVSPDENGMLTPGEGAYQLGIKNILCQVSSLGFFLKMQNCQMD